MNLSNANLNKNYIIKQINIQGKTKERLEELGIISGTTIEVLNRELDGTIIVKTRRFKVWNWKGYW